MQKLCVGLQVTAPARPPPWPATTSRHVSKRTFRWLQPLEFKSSAEAPDCRAETSCPHLDSRSTETMKDSKNFFYFKPLCSEVITYIAIEN